MEEKIIVGDYLMLTDLAKKDNILAYVEIVFVSRVNPGYTMMLHLLPEDARTVCKKISRRVWEIERE